MKRIILAVLLMLLGICSAEAAPTVTVTATSITIIGTNQTISLTCSLVDPNQTGILRSGGTVLTNFSTSTATPGTTATCGPIFGNDVITDGFGNASTSYYLIGVSTVSNGIVASTPVVLQAYQFAGVGTFDLSSTLPFSLGPVSPAGSVLGTNLTFTGNNTHGGTETYTGPLVATNSVTFTNMNAKLVDVVGGAADPLANVNTVANFKLYSVNPGTLPQSTQFHQIDVSGSHTGGNGAFGADMVQFNQARVHDVTGTWPAFWEMQGMESEAEAFGTCSAPCSTTLPNFRLVSIGAQSHVRDSGTDNIVIPFVFDIWGLGPFRDSTSIASRPGTITVTNGSTAVTGSGTNFSTGADAGKLLWVAPNTQGGSMASSGCVITAVISATSMTCTSAWTWLTQTSNFWTTTGTSATGPGGSTSSMTNTLGGYFSQSSAGTSTNFAAAFDGAPGHTEQSIGALWKTNGVNQWSWQTTNNANTQSGDFSLIDFIPSANVFSLRFRNPGNDGASQRGDAYFNASGPSGRVNVNFLPGTGFAGEGAPTNVGTGGLCVGSGGAGAALTANPCALTGVIAIPFGTSIKSCNNGGVTPCAGDIPLIGTTGTNSEQIGDPAAVNILFLSSATAVQVASPLRLNATTIQNGAGTTTMGLTLKKGSGGGNYTTASTTYVVADSTNLCFTVTIPTGWKLGISASGAIGTATGAVLASLALTDNAACGTANAGLLVETTETTTAAGVLQPVSLNWVITGDGAAHNVALQYKTSAGADSATILNASATQLPTMVFTLMPSN